MTADSGSFGEWLRSLPLKPKGTKVKIFNGKDKYNQTAHAAVIDIDVGTIDLQQCADAVIRLRAEYLWAIGKADSIAFNFTSGDRFKWKDWRDGIRPLLHGRSVEFAFRAKADSSYTSFRQYLDKIFAYAGSFSLEKELIPVQDAAQIESGDVFIQGGFPGHAVIVVDVAENERGERVFLLAQSYSPAQDIHILRNPDSDDPWYPALTNGILCTPEWTFDYTDLKRFP